MGEDANIKRTTDFVRRPARALVTEAAEDGHEEAAHASAGQCDGYHCPRFCMPVAVLGNHLDGMCVLDPDARCLLAWDVSHATELEEEEEVVVEEVNRRPVKRLYRGTFFFIIVTYLW